MFKRTLFILVVCLCFSSAVWGSVVPTLGYSSVDLGNGLTGWTFSIHNSDGQLGSYAVTLLFEGTGGAVIRQVDAFGGMVAVDSESDALAYQGKGVPAYQMAQDSWAYLPFGDNPIPGIHPVTNEIVSGFIVGNNSYLMSLGSGPGSMLGDHTKVAYLVADGVVAWQGTISRGTATVETSGVTPEPATLSLLGLGAAALMRRRIAR
jgi:hypothetical protein